MFVYSWDDKAIYSWWLCYQCLWIWRYFAWSVVESEGILLCGISVQIHDNRWEAFISHTFICCTDDKSILHYSYRSEHGMKTLNLVKKWMRPIDDARKTTHSEHNIIIILFRDCHQHRMVWYAFGSFVTILGGFVNKFEGFINVFVSFNNIIIFYCVDITLCCFNIVLEGFETIFGTLTLFQKFGHYFLNFNNFFGICLFNYDST